VIAGCATHTRVVKTETTYEEPTAESAVVRKTESTERRTETRREGRPIVKHFFFYLSPFGNP